MNLGWGFIKSTLMLVFNVYFYELMLNSCSKYDDNVQKVIIFLF